MDLSTIGLKNQLYSEQELDIVRRSQHAYTKKIEVLQDEIRQLEVQIQRFKAIQLRLDIAFAPHNKLPPEVLRRIFELRCEEPVRILPPRPYCASWSIGIYPISHVCSLWRQIALSTPKFWANVSIKLDNDDKSNEHQLQIAEQWLSRAGNHPRSIILTDTVTYPTELHLSLPHTQVMPLKELLKGSFSDYLEILEIRRSKIRLEHRWPNLFAPTTRMTKLIHFRVSAWYGSDSQWSEWDVRSLMTVIPWNQLQYLDLGLWIQYPHSLDILSECTSLVRCRMNVHHDDSLVTMSSAWSSVPTLPALLNLQLSFRSWSLKNEADFERYLSAPRLTHLTLDYWQNNGNTIWVQGAPSVCGLLQCSNGMPNLVSLDLRMGNSLSPISIRALLTMMPQLQLLVIRGIFDEELRNDIATGTLVPQLHSIKTDERHKAIDILRMVELRHQIASMTPQVTEFSSISFSCHSDWDSDSDTPDSQEHSAFSEQLARLKKAAPRLSIRLTFD